MTLGAFASKTILTAQQHRPVHWLYSNYLEHFFDGMDCLGKRDANQLEERIKAIMEDLPWAAESLSRIKYFKPSPDMRKGFEKVLQK